ncbi:MAG TPA: hypothetical protein VKA53_04910, partial [Thermoanaerobaculia bacterium]|nr:hypothetical protein [Thermoanaerobaculia bacterium]
MSSIRRRVVIWVLVVIVVVPVVAISTMALHVYRMNAKGLRLTEAGKAAIGFLGGYGSALHGGDQGAVGDLYAEDYLNPAQAAWTQSLTSNSDGVRAYDWHPGPRSRATKAGMIKQLSEYLSSLEK